MKKYINTIRKLILSKDFHEGMNKEDFHDSIKRIEFSLLGLDHEMDSIENKIEELNNQIIKFKKQKVAFFVTIFFLILSHIVRPW